MSVFDILSGPAGRGTFELHAVHDAATGLRAMVAVHDTRLGPSIGGTRVFPYATESEAVLDVTRLARGMSFKAALAGLPHGGGKAVIWTDKARPIADRGALFRAFGRFVDTLNGRYVTTEDSGTTPADIDEVRSVTQHCLGGSVAKGGSGDPSPYTATGVRRGLEACAEVVLGKSSLAGLRVAIVGVGAVGHHLALELRDAGCQLVVADVAPERVARTVAETGATAVSIDEIYGVECDVFSPCALGGAINDATVSRLNCKVVGGAANNQLATPDLGAVLAARGIFYAPDYAINAGGLINVAEEWRGYDRDAAMKKVLAIRETIAAIAERSLRTGALPGEIADRMVEEILAQAGAQPLAPIRALVKEGARVES